MPPKKRPTYKKKNTFQISKQSMNTFIDITIAYLNFTDKNIDQIKKELLRIIHDREIKEIATSTKPEEVGSAFSKLRGYIESVPSDSTPRELIEAINSDRNNADKNYAVSRNEIAEVWKQSMFESDPLYAPPSWIKDPVYGEKFMPFLERDERYVYAGYKNQVLLSSALENAHGSNITITKQEIQSIVNQTFELDSSSDKSEEDQKKSHLFASLKGKPSISSIYIPKIYENYTMPDGSRWKSNDPKIKKPSKDQMATQNIRKQETVSYLSAPVWSIDQFKEHLNQNQLDKLEKLKTERIPEVFRSILMKEKSTTTQALDKIVTERINKMINEQSVRTITTSIGSRWKPIQDEVSLLEKGRYFTPIDRFRTAVHELAHSTAHLLGRRINYSTLKATEELYAVEEVVAETVAYLHLKSFQEELREAYGDEYPSEWDSYFAKVFQKNKEYIHNYTHINAIKKSFEAVEKEVMKGNFGILEDTLKSIIQAQQVLTNGTLNGKPIDIMMRIEKRKENLDKWNPKDPKRNKESGFVLN